MMQSKGSIMNNYILLTNIVLCTPLGLAQAANTTNTLLENYARQGDT